jgi:hypothetical protein
VELINSFFTIHNTLGKEMVRSLKLGLSRRTRNYYIKTRIWLIFSLRHKLNSTDSDLDSIPGSRYFLFYCKRFNLLRNSRYMTNLDSSLYEDHFYIKHNKHYICSIYTGKYQLNFTASPKPMEQNCNIGSSSIRQKFLLLPINYLDRFGRYRR